MKLLNALWKKVLPPNLFVISIVLMILLSLLWFKSVIMYPYNLLGIFAFLLGLYISRWGSDKFQKVETNINTFQEPDKMVTDGLFRYSRNPMYLGFVIALLGISVILGTIFAFFILIMFILITDQWYIKFEEKMMIKKFGDRYVEYMKTTRRWI